MIKAKALINSGCTRCVINRDFVNKNKINQMKLPRKVKVLNADGSENSSGRITHHSELIMQMGKRHEEEMDFGITKLDGHDIFLGYDWLHQEKPQMLIRSNFR